MRTECPQNLADALEEVGLSWRAIERTAKQIILFGSRASGVEDDDSDWDLLLVGPGHTVRLGLVDLVLISGEKLESKKWLGSELAGHVAAYGVWIKGDSSWKTNVYPSQVALERKRLKIQARLHGLEKNWELLGEPYRKKHFELIRRDMQRYAIMREKEPVPATPTIDAQWHADISRIDFFTKVARQCGLLSTFVEQQLSNFAEEIAAENATIRSLDQKVQVH